MLRMLRSVELLAAALLAAFAFLRCMELTNVYCQSRLHLGLHLGLALLAACRPGLPRVTLLSVLYGVMYHRLDVQVYAAPEAMRLDGAIVVIAGGSNGIGLALAHELARLNATTVLGCRNLTKCEIVRPAGARCVQLDLADLRSIVQFAGEVRSSVPRVDFLVHNAGFVADGLHGRTVQGFELSFGVMHLGHHLLTRELWSLLQRPSPSALPARVVSHASAAFMTGDFSSLLAGDGAGDLRGEVMDGCLSGSSSVQDHLLGTFHTLAKLYLGVPLPRGKAALCPFAGVYSRAKLAQVLFSQELQHRSSQYIATSRAAEGSQSAREVVALSLHPGTVRSGIVALPDWLVRPTAMGARVLLYCLLEDVTPGSFVDEMQSPHDLLLATTRGDDPQVGRPRDYVYSVPIAAYMAATEGRPADYRARLWELSELLVAPYASTDTWSF